jgi:hypothetical protein
MKTTKIITIAVIAICAMLVCSCDTKQQAISELEQLSKELYLESNNYTDADWQDAKVKYEQIKINLEKHAAEYTGDEKKYIKKTQLECEAYFAGNGVKGWLKGLKEEVEDFFSTPAPDDAQSNE